MKLVGLLPAGGRAARINGLPKYLLPIPGGNLMARHAAQMHDAGADAVLVAAGFHNMGLVSTYAPAGTEVYALDSKTVGEALVHARQFTRDRAVLFGMPDTYWQAEDVYARLTDGLRSPSAIASVALWVMREDQRGLLGQCDVDYPRRAISAVVDKDPACEYPWIWGAVAWTPDFWSYIKADHTHLGQALQLALGAGKTIDAAQIDGEYHDCGSFASYARLCGQFTEAVA